MARFQVREGEHPVSGDPRYTVVDTDNDELPVARFDSRAAAEAHAQRLAEGPFDWDEQEAWQDDWDDDEQGGQSGDGA
ncbi:MAG: hypothetical protein KY437_05415 [Actinobacteria bacterium]|nr:hypothetical protein [Actinomycetota bacterium]